MKRLAAAIIEDTRQRIYLQLRDSKPGSGHPGHWGCLAAPSRRSRLSRLSGRFSKII